MPARPDLFSAPDHAEGEFFSDAADSATKTGRRGKPGKAAAAGDASRRAA
jgi:hypothetical protein